MDAGALIRAARGQARLSQGALARLAGTSQPKIAAYERGRISPTVRTLDRLLAAAGLQARVGLEPLLADVDSRVDAMVGGIVALDTDALARIATSLDEIRRWVAEDPEDPESTADLDAEPVRCSGRPRWAFDGEQALTLHGLAVDVPAPCLVLVWEPATQAWLSQVMVQGIARVVGWWSVDLEEARHAVSKGVVCRLGWLAVRLEPELPPVLQIQPPGLQRVVPVVTVDEVERSFPPHADALARWRERRGRG